jgi:hypothetical protein
MIFRITTHIIMSLSMKVKKNETLNIMKLSITVKNETLSITVKNETLSIMALPEHYCVKCLLC